MTIIEMRNLLVIEGYMNLLGFVTIKPNDPEDQGNGLLQTGLFYVIKAVHGALTQVDKDTIDSITEQCRHDSVPMLWRSPLKKNHDDNQNWDDYTGWLAAMYFSGHKFPMEFLGWGLTHSWSFDIQNPYCWNPDYYFERQIGFTTFAKMCARGFDPKVPITPLEHAMLALAILWSAFSIDKSDSCMKSYCRIAVARKESWACHLASLIWFWRVRKKYGITGQAFSAYFQSKAHPLTLGDWN